MMQKTKYTQVEQRRKRFLTPMIYMMSEIILVWLILSIINVSFNIMSWGILSYVVLSIGTVYSMYKTSLIYKRQKGYQEV